MEALCCIASVWRNNEQKRFLLSCKLFPTCTAGIGADFDVEMVLEICTRKNVVSIILFNRVCVCVCVFCACLQVQTDVHLDTKQQTMQGVAFPMQRDAIEALEQFKNRRINYVQLVSNTYLLSKSIYLCR